MLQFNNNEAAEENRNALFFFCFLALVFKTSLNVSILSLHVNNSHYRTEGMWETAALSSSSSGRVLACLACPLQSSHVCSCVKCFLSSSEAPHYRERLLVPSFFSCATGCNCTSTNASIRSLSQQSILTLVLLQFENVRRQTDAAMVSTWLHCNSSLPGFPL